MLDRNQTFYLRVGTFSVSVVSDIRAVQRYLYHHYEKQLFSPTDDDFIDYNIEVKQGPVHRRLYKPQATFSFNYQTPFKPLPLDQSIALLEWGLNWVIAGQANHLFIIHAATVAKDGKGIIISAPSGSGKSTLCAYLVSKGWQLLSDELALISPETMELYGLGRPINLKNRSIDLMKPYYSEDSFSDIASDTHKGDISLLKPTSGSTLTPDFSVTPSHLVFVKFNQDEVCYIEPVEKSLALTEIIKNSFNFSLLNKKGFDCAKKLVNQTQAVYIEYNCFESCEQALLNTIADEYPCDQAS